MQQDRNFQDISDPILYRSRLAKVRPKVCLYRFHSLQHLSCFDHGTVLANWYKRGTNGNKTTDFGHLDPYLCLSSPNYSDSQGFTVNFGRRKGIFWKLCKCDWCLCICLSSHLPVLFLENKRKSTRLLHSWSRFLLWSIPFTYGIDASLDANLPVLDCLQKFQILHYHGRRNYA